MELEKLNGQQKEIGETQESDTTTQSWGGPSWIDHLVVHEANAYVLCASDHHEGELREQEKLVHLAERSNPASNW